jgi:hypothetical protein
MQWVLPGGSAKFKNPNADNPPLLEGGVLVDEGTVPSVVLDIGQFSLASGASSQCPR